MIYQTWGTPPICLPAIEPNVGRLEGLKAHSTSNGELCDDAGTTIASSPGHQSLLQASSDWFCSAGCGIRFGLFGHWSRSAPPGPTPFPGIGLKVCVLACLAGDRRDTFATAGAALTEPLSGPDDLTYLGYELFVAFHNGVGLQDQPAGNGTTFTTVVGSALVRGFSASRKSPITSTGSAATRGAGA